MYIQSKIPLFHNSMSPALQGLLHLAPLLPPSSRTQGTHLCINLPDRLPWIAKKWVKPSRLGQQIKDIFWLRIFTENSEGSSSHFDPGCELLPLFTKSFRFDFFVHRTLRAFRNCHNHFGVQIQTTSLFSSLVVQWQELNIDSFQWHSEERGCFLWKHFCEMFSFRQVSYSC